MKHTLFAFIAIVSISCSTGHKLRKAQKLINEAKAEGAKVRVDTVFKDREKLIKGESITNTIVKTKDTTIYVVKDRIKIKEVFRHDTIFQFIQCPDSVVKSKEAIAVNETIECPPVSNFWKIVAITTLVIFAGFVWINRK